jgi:predicted DNA-binding ribbon-helix-helix protein
MAQARHKRSLTIARHRTSVTLEDAFWEALGDIARAERKSVAALVGEIDQGRAARTTKTLSLSAAIRLFVLERTRGRSLRKV